MKTNASLTCRTFSRCDDVPWADWERARTHGGENLFMDLRFLALIEATMSDVSTIRHVIVYGPSGEPVACTCLPAANHERDLYFNLMYAELDHGLRSGVRVLHVGQASDTFKARLGCRLRPLHLFPLLFPPLPPVPQPGIFNALARQRATLAEPET